MSSIVSAIVIIGTIGSLVGFFAILWLNRKVTRPGQTTGHAYDGIEEYDNPMPAWWYWSFILSILFGIGYLIYYPGLGNFPGIAGWTQEKALQESVAEAESRYGEIFDRYAAIPIPELAHDGDALKVGRRLFANNCAVCHGGAGTGSYGFPNLTDSEWQWGGSPEQIKQTIMQGRNAVMTPFGNVLSDQEISDVATWVMSLAGREVDKVEAERGVETFNNICIACHGPDGKGNAMLGAPDLTNEIWLYGGSRLRIEHTIRHGRQGMMPTFEQKLGPEKVHILAAYVMSLAENQGNGQMSDSGGGEQ